MKRQTVGAGSQLRSFKSRSHTDLMTTAQRSAHMALVRRAGTGPELAVRRLLRDLRIRFTTENRDLPGSPDMANRSRKFAIFVHGCYWHRHPGCSRTTTPTNNLAFWQAKFDANVLRDRRVVRLLRKEGYKVLMIWECRTKNLGTLGRRLARELSAH